ncbi:TIGR02147 family protein [Bdellovibrio sp. HCB337]|uniref:TIGR02147 family protein n=1 Tax=Bdellovibrio sp. HCB337 TaxID=3394358 RepID=UPI0039A5A411
MKNTSVYYEDYRKYLKEAFEKRVARNPSYSQRAFARDLGLAISTLTELMKGKYGLSSERALDVGQRLSLSEAQCQHFADLFTMKFARSDVAKKKAKAAVQKRLSQVAQEIQDDAFLTISEWHHLALLELLEIEAHSFESSHILAARLGISKDEAHASLQRLERLDLIFEKEGRLVPTGDVTSVGDGKASEAVRRFHAQILEKAHKALALYSIEEREMSSTVFSINRKDLPSAKKYLQNFRRDFATRFSKSSNLNDVFCLSVQFFSVLEKESVKD